MNYKKAGCRTKPTKVQKYAEGGLVHDYSLPKPDYKAADFQPKEPIGSDVDLPRVSPDDRYPGRSRVDVEHDLGRGFSVEGRRTQWRDEPPAYGARLTYRKGF